MGKSLPKTILVVEDDFELRRVICTALEEAGFRTVAAADGSEALRSLRSRKPDMILTDLQMPKVDGFSFRETLARDPALAVIPVIVMTGLLGDALAQAGLSALNLILKPFDVNALVERIKSHFPVES